MTLKLIDSETIEETREVKKIIKKKALSAKLDYLREQINLINAEITKTEELYAYFSQ